jgi:alpha-1,4-digalacturonate transport system substrate-binding protein
MWTRPIGKKASAAPSTGIAAGLTDDGIYGMHSQLTVTGAFVNATLFEQAGRDAGRRRTWADWAEASRAVAEATVHPSRWRLTAPVTASPVRQSPMARLCSMRTATPILVDDGFTAFVQQFVDWHEDGTIARDVWAGQGGRPTRTPRRNSSMAIWCSTIPASWQVGRMDEQVGDFFDWQVVGSPCGPAGACSGMPGGAGIVGFAQTEHPEAVAA